MMNSYINLLPDDIIDLIYSKIYFEQNNNIFIELKALYYIKNNLIHKYGLFDLTSCLLIHIDRNSNFDNIELLLSNIEKINSLITELSYDNLYKLFVKSINNLKLNEKIEFIFYMEDNTIHGYVDKDIIYNTVIYILNKKMIY